MAHSSKYICDRCKDTSEATDGHCAPPPNGWIVVMISNVNVADLCSDCAQKLKLFLKGEIR
jgi:hypothetical protein